MNLTGSDTPVNNGVTLACVACNLNFTTGANTLEAPPQWTWAGGGNFTLIGDIPALGLDDAVLVSGGFTGTSNTPGLAGAGSTALFISLGIDTKNATLASFYGLGPNFTFANTAIALRTFVQGADGSFSAVPNQADLINIAVLQQIVPLPPTGLLVGLGLLLMGSAAGLRRFV